MPVCSVCKETKEDKHKWKIREHAADNALLREFIVCEACAFSIARKVLVEVPKEIPEPLKLTGSSLLDAVILKPDNTLEFVLSMDLAKARRFVLNSTEEK